MTQHQKILDVLEEIQGEHNIPEDYIRRHKSGDGISSRYFKQVMLISEANGRISELRYKGHKIETSAIKDKYGFAYHRLSDRKSPIEVARELVVNFDKV